jgi:hypothetical protein
MTKPRKVARRNPVAQDLRRPQYRKRVQQDRKRLQKAGYSKHTTKGLDQ